MTKTTPTPNVDVLRVLPELAQQTAVTIRLHPRSGNVSDLSASKMAGTFLWPSDEPWPTEAYYPPMEYVPVLQINAKDVPDFPFPPGKDLMQMLWLPDTDWESNHLCPPRFYWRDSHLIHSALSEIPPSRGNHSLTPKPCTLTFERIVEFPSIYDLSVDQVDRLKNWDIHEFLALYSDWKDNKYDHEKEPIVQYQYNFSVCPGNKLGGYVHWKQDPQWQTCNCGKRMKHLLTIRDMDVDGGSWRRWLPREDRELWENPWNHEENFNAPGLQLGAGAFYYFICRSCPDWPVKYVYQR